MEKKELVKVGFWSPPDEYPNVRDHVDSEWKEEFPEEYEALCLYLLTAGYAYYDTTNKREWGCCRLCGCVIPEVGITDQEYLWPSGLAHYVRHHSVRIPNPRFIEHALLKIANLADTPKKCQSISSPRVAPGWGCCKCRSYNGMWRKLCKSCGHKRCDDVEE
jgi:hypothetical protein